ncbi:efflux RND transporter periplasmic adaptor subunit [Rhodocyclus tenuis]|uniref:efflux RND transporter periplasmic adaptor subunit n=1 Tax=Rhodocyclus gracilis TaxID=2929842 RepID=UPI001298AC90|nr:efflux RND transporter periplasmic adaptor subunit [Rhodocyclus gracilis]MRD72593.1 efflux RND transporter periplasmic adaptor subunit [Rhodocyclus gracilis]
MRTLLIPFLLLPLTLAMSHASAAETPAMPLLAISAQQANALGVASERLSHAGNGLASGLPAEVRIPNEQLRVVAAPLPGMVVAIDVATGQTVKQGQTLARLASPSLLAAERDFLQAAQSAHLAAQAARRDEQLFSEGIIAEARVQTTRANHEQAALALAARRAELQLAGVSDGALTALAQQRRLPSEMLISAPIAGIVLEQSVQPGQRVDAAAPLFRIGKLTPLWLEIETPAALASTLREGAAVSVPAVGARGKVINIGRQISAGSQTVTVRARLDAGGDPLSPGQRVAADIDVPVRSDGFRVPQSALVRIGGDAFVFVAEGAGYRPLAIKIVGQAGDQVILQSARLTPQTRIAIKGVAALKSIWGSAAESASAAAGKAGEAK